MEMETGSATGKRIPGARSRTTLVRAAEQLDCTLACVVGHGNPCFARAARNSRRAGTRRQAATRRSALGKQQSLHAYEERYRRVFEAGALHWNDPEPNPHLSELLDRLAVGAKCVEFGCGEGYQRYLMASRRMVVTGVALSPAAITKAIRLPPPALAARFLVGDVTEDGSLALEPSSFRLVVHIGCLHMMAETEDRTAHLRLVHSLPVSGGMFFFQNSLDLDDASVRSDTDREHIAQLKE